MSAAATTVLTRSMSAAAAAPASAFSILREIGHTLYERQESSDVWKGTPLEEINKLKPDIAGKVGELFIERLCQASGIPVVTTGDINSKDGTYDQKIGDAAKKTEIKTARLGGGKFQHETLKASGYDYMLFLDIYPASGIITVLPPFDLKARHTITGTTPTLRKGAVDVYKWDFTERHHERLLEAGVAIRFTPDTPLEVIATFLRTKIV